MQQRVDVGEDMAADAWERIDKMADGPYEVLETVAGLAGALLGMGTAAAEGIEGEEVFLRIIRETADMARREFHEGMATSDVGRG